MVCCLYLYFALFIGCLRSQAINWRKKLGFSTKLVLTAFFALQVQELTSLLSKLPEGSIEYISGHLHQPLVMFCTGLLCLFFMLNILYSVIVGKLMKSMIDQKVLM